MPSSPIIIVLMMLLVLQYMAILNKGAAFLPRPALVLVGQSVTGEALIVWGIGVTVAGLALGVVIADRYGTVDRWYASMLLALMLGHCTCVWKTEDPSWRKAYLKELREKTRTDGN
jgi:hypothetical protein